MKPIDPLTVKKAVQQGQLEVVTIRSNIILRDTTSGEAAKIGEVKNEHDERTY